KNFKYIHFVLVQVTIKPLTRQGLNTSILACLRDDRHLNFDDSLIGAIETSLCNGPVYFDGYPDLTISLTDKNILETLKINIKLHGYNMLPGSEIIVIIHHLHYKATNSICPKSLVNLSKGETTMMKIYTQDDSQNDFQEINELISPTYSEMKPPSQLMTIIIDETFEINKNLIRKDFLQEKYLRKRYRFFQKHSEIEQNNIRTAWYEYMIKIKAHIMFFDYLPIYKNQQDNKKYFTEEKIQKIFMNQKTTTTWLTSDNKIIEVIHPPSEKIQINIQNNQIQAAPFKLQNETSSNQTTQETNKIIEQNNYTSRHLQTLGSQLSRIENIIQDKIQHSREETKNQDQKIKPLFTPYKIPSSQIKQLTLNEINERLRQIVPDSPELDTPSLITTTSTPRTPHKDKNKVINVIQEIETSSDDSIQEITKQLSNTKIDPLKIESLTSYYYRPTYPDLQIEERGKFTQASYQSRTIYEWNIDGMNEYHIINKLQEMTMVSNAHKIRNNSDKAVANILIAGFTGQIKGCIQKINHKIKNNKIKTICMINTDKQKETNLLIKLTDKIDNPELKIEYLLKLKDLITNEPSTSTSQPYTLQKIFQKFEDSSTQNITLQDLQKEIKDTKQELQKFKQKTKKQITNLEQILLQKHSSSSSDKEIEQIDQRETSTKFINLIEKITYQKWHVNITITIQDSFKLQTIALIDSGAQMNCIQEGLIPTKYFEKTKQKLSTANGEKLRVNFKVTNVHICKKGIIKQSFILVKDLDIGIILGQPFLEIIKPFKVTNEGITTKLFQQKILQLQNSQIKEKIDSLKNNIIKNLCSDLPDAFWHRKRHMVSLPYEKDFTEQNIPTKARPIQMNYELMVHCKKEIQELLSK
ncbi:LOW QUALITY PROTEIN: MP domain-containing protein, partial [Cephalotus follicularis]